MPAERHTIGLMLALALLVRLLVPTGWMPEVDAQGIRLTWCGSAGPPPPAFVAAMTEAAERLHGGHHGPDHGGDADHKKPGGDQPCAYAGLAFAALDQAMAALEAPFDAPSSAVPPAMVAAVGRGLAAPPPPSTGPPHLI
jgi:hypothetical protein